MNAVNVSRGRFATPALALCAIAMTAATIVLHAQPTIVGAHGAKAWIGRTREMEAHLRTAAIDRVEPSSVGVTRPTHVFLRGGGPFSEMLWKPLAPGRYRGYQESYKSEIAAYELDKLLDLEMTPPTVERTIDGQVGAAVMWVAGVRSFAEIGSVPRPGGRHVAAWNRQLVRAKMFDNLIGNEDPNLGNWLVDAEWNLILIDHSRAFRTDARLTHELSRVHKDLWTRMTSLSEEEIASSAAGRWLDADQIRAMMTRRSEMRRIVNGLVERKASAAYVP